MALMSQFKVVEISQKELEEYKVKAMVVEHFNKQMESLNIEKLKNDFEDCYSRMKRLEIEMSFKMKEINMVFQEVEAGFSRNARDRSDYLNHYERMYMLTDTSVLQFKESLLECKTRLEKLSTCVLTIVNEEEAAKIQDMGITTYKMSDDAIRVNIP